MPSKKKSKSKVDALSEILKEIEETEVATTLPRYGNGFHVELGKGWVVSFDWHVPIHDIEMVKRLCKIGKNTFPSLEGLIIGGDFLNHDVLGKFDDFTVPPTLKDEYGTASKLLKTLCRAFKRVIVMGGNHDYRFTRHMKGQLDVEFVYHSLCRANNFTYTKANRIELGDHLIICHPASSYSRIRAKVPANLANKFGKCIMSGHTHHGGLVMADNARHWACEPGAMLSIKKVEYCHRYLNNKPEFVNGFAAVLPDKDGFPKPMMFVEGLTDWEAWQKRKW